MGNVIYDIGPDWIINPFIGAGVGVNHIELTTDGQFSNVTGVVTAQGGANPPIQNLHIDLAAAPPSSRGQLLSPAPPTRWPTA